MKFTLTIECDNAAFADNPGIEVAEILRRQVIEQLDQGYQAIYLVDSNGNRASYASFSEGE
jgi:cytochrome c-type biogenesis protein CcmH/NrfF